MPGGVASRPVVIPFYNGGATLQELVARLEPFLHGCAGQFEAVLVNDGSHDASWETLVELRRRYGWIRPIDLMPNSGQHSALLCGIRAARHELIVTLDDDLQNPPEEIPKLLEALADDRDVGY